MFQRSSKMASQGVRAVFPTDLCMGLTVFFGRALLTRS